MKISGGTSAALDLIKRLKESGHLIDVYSKEWMSKANNAAFNEKVFDKLVKLHGDRFTHHLLVVSLSDYNKEIEQGFLDVYPRLSKVLSDGVHLPNFLFINLYTQQLLVVGLGRKNSFFAIPVDVDLSLDMSNLSQNSYIKEFTALDCSGVIDEICRSVEALGICFCEYEDLYASQDDDLSEDEQAELEDQMSEVFERQAKMRDVIANYFPDFDETEINSGDF
ncbi:hypothetical protein [Polynucleobacter sp. KF022]|uniref:hypothetical protein n=1 Tax=Polynucleobacter sp. KF022 TaxID=2982615 RepID=UPI002376EA8D|nr:hypothetical protein [Polynucleobacter sp. KF022]BDT75803.1 hypothetical protein PKF022_14680 [Polynucleobacter sp. KF022]